MCNVLEGKSNGEERDRAWGWKSGKGWEEARERAKALRREVRDVEEGGRLSGKADSGMQQKL